MNGTTKRIPFNFPQLTAPGLEKTNHEFKEYEYGSTTSFSLKLHGRYLGQVAVNTSDNFPPAYANIHVLVIIETENENVQLSSFVPRDVLNEYVTGLVTLAEATASF